jgi:hypothetical protein
MEDLLALLSESVAAMKEDCAAIAQAHVKMREMGDDIIEAVEGHPCPYLEGLA